MKLSGLLVASLCSLVLFAACKKKNDDNNKSATKQMLEDGKWQMTASTATLNYMGKDTTYNLYSMMEECDKDDIMTFADNGSASVNEGANKCTKDPQIESAPWVLLNNDTKLAIVDSNPDTMDVEITTIQMKLKQVKPNSSGTPVTYIDTYKNVK